MAIRETPTESEDEQETVWIRGTDRTWGDGGTSFEKFHTDKDCPQLKQSASVRPKDRKTLEGHKTLCKVCSGESNGGVEKGEDPGALRDTLLGTNPDDLFGGNNGN